MTGLENNAHATLPQSSLQLITTIEDGLSRQGRQSGIAVLGTVVYVVGETAPTGWTFFHLVARPSRGILFVSLYDRWVAAAMELAFIAKKIVVPPTRRKSMLPSNLTACPSDNTTALD